MTSLLKIAPKTARRLAISRQRLDARPAEHPKIMDVVRDLGCLQIDPMSTVARSHTLVLFSRIGPYEVKQLDRLIYQERQLFEYWAHAASFVLTEDYPIHHLRMRTYAKKDDPWHQRVAEWIQANQKLHDYILREVRKNGPVSARSLTEAGEVPKTWVSSGWTGDRNVSRMIDFLWMQGKIMVAQRQGLNKFWDMADRVLPEWTPREKWSEKEIVTRAAQRSLHALGVGTEKQIGEHYISGRYPELRERLKELEQAGEVERVEIEDWRTPKKSDAWYIHAVQLPQVEAIERGEWEGRTVLLSPFDNLIRDRKRTAQFWDFDYRIEIYTPQAKRKYGYYVLPILHNDQLIGRIDPQMDRAKGVLNVNAVHVEENAPQDQKTGRAVRDAIEELGEFLGANEIKYTGRVPEKWKRVLR